ncbi:hypothetical protein F5148DRAFT_540875 [Russula earlei]|uniref:Uncharacterized protein n=1 Tax=Russula earlei TaxID=71964 RepID=A0ACC0UHX8_9AGAM|nr:hypothetical protein F5148DRAFT_540875 [Russula earlei]
MGNYCCIAARGGTTDPDSTTPTRPKPARARQRPATPPSSRRMIALPAPSSQTTLLSSAPSLDGGHPLKSKAGFGPRREEPSPLAPWADQAPAKNDEDRSRPFTSAVQSVLSDDFRFRILVAGKPGSGKSSLINSIFKVPTSAASANVSGDIDARFCTRGNRYLVVHEYSGLESRDLETIQDFVRTRSDPNYSMPESLHAIWICISVLELVHGKLDEGVKDILCLGVPVVLVFTKLDELALSRVAFGDSEDLETARSTAHTMCERSFRSLFHENSGVVSAAIVSIPGFGDLISKLVTTTDDVIIAQSRKLSRTQRAQPRMSPVLLAWSISQRASHDLIIRAAIEVGRSKCWRGLSSSDDFAGHTLESFLDVIHTDIVDVWNFPDKDKYLWCEVFKADIFRLVKDWSGSGSGSGPLHQPLGKTQTKWYTKSRESS